MKRTRITRSAVLSGVAVLVAATATGASGAARADSAENAATASGRCSVAAAHEVVERLRLRNADADPFLKVLCGAFTGSGSETMVVSISGGGNSGLIEWVVFRWAGGGWQFLMKQPAAASITAAGSDIRQTLPVYLPDDSRCCPSGGTKTRVWHWTGSRFSHSAWNYSTPSSQRTPRPTKLLYFQSPSHNIWCDSGDDGKAYCATNTPPRSVTLSHDGTLTICASCRGPSGSRVPVLSYGQVNEQGGYRCQSKQTGMTCTVIVPGKGFGKGFLINRDGVTRVG